MLKLSRGSTLIELAIVLMVIGLLLGGILKGRELIKSARAPDHISRLDGIKGDLILVKNGGAGTGRAGFRACTRRGTNLSCGIRPGPA